MTYRAVIGARAHRDLATVWRDVQCTDGGVVSGRADGPDTVGVLAAMQQGRATHEIHVSTWDGQTREEYTREALKRNAEIIEACAEVEAYPWGDSNGTWHAVGLARKAGKPVRIHEPPPDLTPGPLLVFSSRFAYSGRRRLDITRGSGRGNGAFAPSREILNRVLEARKRSQDVRKQADEMAKGQRTLSMTAEETWGLEMRAAELVAQADRLDGDAWAWYVPRFQAEQRISYGMRPGATKWTVLEQEAWDRGVRPDPKAWATVRGLAYVVLVCYCPDAERCHRSLVRRNLVALGAVDGGEVPWREGVAIGVAS